MDQSAADSVAEPRTNLEDLDVQYMDPETEIILNDQKFMMVFNARACKEISKRTKGKINVLSAAGFPVTEICDMETLQIMVQCGLLKKHKEVTMEQLDDWMHMKNITYVMTRVLKGIEVVQPVSKASENGSKGSEYEPHPFEG